MKIKLRNVGIIALLSAVLGVVIPISIGGLDAARRDARGWPADSFLAPLMYAACPFAVLAVDSRSWSDYYQILLMNAVLWSLVGMSVAVVRAKHPRVLWSILLLPGAWAAAVGAWWFLGGHLTGVVLVICGALAPLIPIVVRSLASLRARRGGVP